MTKPEANKNRYQEILNRLPSTQGKFDPKVWLEADDSEAILEALKQASELHGCRKVYGVDDAQDARTLKTSEDKISAQQVSDLIPGTTLATIFIHPEEHKAGE